MNGGKLGRKKGDSYSIGKKVAAGKGEGKRREEERDRQKVVREREGKGEKDGMR